tara:strand:+ start:533 stop:1156 length:624 start_codon:yes stop_codon:yes gene_type:complete
MTIDIIPILNNYFTFFQTPIGIFTFICLYALWVIILLPGLWLSMLAGVIYGSTLGSIFVFLGAFVGAEITFILARSLLRKWIQKRLINLSKLHAIESALSKEGLKLIILTRLSPIFPFSLMNLIYGLSKVSFLDFSVGLIAILPGTILYCGLGSLAGDIARFKDVISNKNDINSFLFSLLGLFATFAVVWIISKTARKALQEMDYSL